MSTLKFLDKSEMTPGEAARRKLEDENKKTADERMGKWKSDIRILQLQGKDLALNVLNSAGESNTRYHPGLFAINSRVDTEYCVKLLNRALKDPGLTEKERSAIEKFAKELGRMAQHDAVFEKIYMAEDLRKAGFKGQAIKIINGVAPKVVEMANFYKKEMEKKPDEGPALYANDPLRLARRKELDDVGTVFTDHKLPLFIARIVLGNQEPFSHDTLCTAIEPLVSARHHEQDLIVASAMKAGLFRKV